MENIQNSHKFIHELRVLFGISMNLGYFLTFIKLWFYAYRRIPTSIWIRKRQKKRELSLEIRKQMKIIKSTLPALSLFLNTCLPTNCRDHRHRFFHVLLIYIVTCPDSLVKEYLAFSSCCIVFWLEKLTIRNLIYSEKGKSIKNVTALTIVYKYWQPKIFLPLCEKHLNNDALQFLS